MASPSPTAGQQFLPEQSLDQEVIDLSDDEPPITLTKPNSRRLLETRLKRVSAHAIKAHLERVQTEFNEYKRATRNEKRELLDRIEYLEDVEKHLENQAAVLKDMLKDDEKNIIRLSGQVKDLKKEIEGLSKEAKDLERQQLICSVCASRVVDSVTLCGHLFCLRCLEEEGLHWRRRIDPFPDPEYSELQEQLQGILKCPVCREWVQLATVKPLHP
jgi:rubrerythrin